MRTKLRTMMMALLIATLATVMVSGCTTNPYTGQQQANRTALGTGFGAAGGALVGQLIGGNTAGTLIGAGVGALAGGVAGNYMDRQAAELRAQLQGTGVQVIQNGSDVTLVMPGDITFATNQSTIQSQFYTVLNSVSLVLKKYNRTAISVTGYTDNVGAPLYNQRLSLARAQSVASYLMSQGISSSRFVVQGNGELNPVASNQTVAGRAQNRRVVINLHSV